MKRKPLIFSLLSLPFVGALLWGVNYRLNHPPLTKADKEFRALVAGADSIEVVQRGNRDQFKAAEPIIYPPLDAAQTNQLIEQLRLTDAKSMLETDHKLVGKIDYYALIFKRQGTELKTLTLSRAPNESGLEWMIQSAPPNQNHYAVIRRIINPRFEKSLRRTLDELVPNRRKFQ